MSNFRDFMFSKVAPTVNEDTICFLIYGDIDMSKFEAYRTIKGILNNNIYNFIILISTVRTTYSW